MGAMTFNGQHIDVLGEPKTVIMGMMHRGMKHSAHLEVWITALIAVMTPEQKEVLFRTVDQLSAQLESMSGKARVVAEIQMPIIG